MQETGQDVSQDNTAGDAAETRATWWRRMSGGLKRSSSALSAVTDLVTKRFLDETMLEEIHDGLLRADLGLDTAARITQALSESRQRANMTPDEVKAVVAAEVEKTLTDVAQPLVVDPAKKPFVILVAGVNGSGKTT